MTKLESIHRIEQAIGALDHDIQEGVIYNSGEIKLLRAHQDRLNTLLDDVNLFQKV